MFEKFKKHESLLKGIGAVVLTLAVLYAWFIGFLAIIFYIFGFYVAIYIISRLFKTTMILGFLMAAGTFFLYAVVGISLLWLCYLALKTMFEGSFFYGLLLLFIGLPISQLVIYGIGMGVGFILGMPLVWMIEDLEKREEASKHRSLKAGYPKFVKWEGDVFRIDNTSPGFTAFKFVNNSWEPVGGLGIVELEYEGTPTSDPTA